MDEAFPFEGKILVSDLQGPITANDNARELIAAVVENGDRLFQAVRRYEKVLSNVSRKEGVKPGDSLRLILPFLKAYGATDSSLLRFSRESMRIVPGADKAYVVTNAETQSPVLGMLVGERFILIQIGVEGATTEQAVELATLAASRVG